MRIAFDNVNFESFTGPNQMAFKLGTELQHNFDCEIVNANESEYDIVLVFIEQNKLAHNGVPIIQRLDGIWFKPEDFEIKNKQIRKTYDSVNAHIFQSEFDKQMIQKHFGKRDVPNIVIRNGTYAKNMFHKIKETSELEWLLNIRNDFDKIFDKAYSNNVVVEVNSFPDRVDLDDSLIKKAIEHKVRLAINTDAHSQDNMNFMRFGIFQARRGWCEKKNVINTLNKLKF